MASDTTEAALGLLGAVQDPKATKKILDEIKAEQTKLKKAREDFAAERRECMEIKKQQRRDADLAENLAEREAKCRAEWERVMAARKGVDAQVAEMADINEARKQAENKTAYARRQATKLEKSQDVFDRAAAHNKDVLARLAETVQASMASLEG